MDRKAQLLGHIIVFVIGLIVVATVLYFGYQVLDNLNEERCELKEVEFGTALSTLLERKRDYGAQDIIQLEMPCEAVGACFIDRDAIDRRAQEPAWPAEPTPLIVENAGPYADTITSSYARGSPANVFVLYTDGSARSLDRFDDVAAPIEVHEDRALCFQAPNGVLRVRFEGTGRTVQVSHP